MGNSAEQDLRARFEAIRNIEGENQAAFDAATARNLLKRDLGEFDMGYFDSSPAYYDLDQETRDRLLAHAGQDAAHAVLSMRALSKEVQTCTRHCGRRSF